MIVSLLGKLRWHDYCVHFTHRCLMPWINNFLTWYIRNCLLCVKYFIDLLRIPYIDHRPFKINLEIFDRGRHKCKENGSWIAQDPNLYRQNPFIVVDLSIDFTYDSELYHQIFWHHHAHLVVVNNSLNNAWP